MTHSRSTSDTHDVQNISTPVGLQLSGKYKKSFAYVTIKDRLPVILTRVIDHFSRNKEAIKNIYGEIESITAILKKLETYHKHAILKTIRIEPRTSAPKLVSMIETNYGVKVVPEIVLLPEKRDIKGYKEKCDKRDINLKCISMIGMGKLQFFFMWSAI